MSSNQASEELQPQGRELKEGSKKISRRSKPTKIPQLMVDRFPEAAFLLEADARFSYVNEAACNALGYSKAELLTMTGQDIDPEFPQEFWTENWAEVKRQGSVVIESHHYAKDGRIFPVEITMNHFEFNGKESLCIFARDITERKRAEAELLEYQKAVESSEDLITAVNREYVYTLANDTFLRYHGLNRDQVIGQTVDKVMGENIFKNLIKPNADRCFEGKAVDYEMPYCFSEFGERNLLVSYYPLKGDTEKVSGIVVVTRDITVPKKAAEGMRESEKRYRLLAENVTDIIWTMDMGMNFTYVSPSVTQLRGFSVEEALAQPIEESMTPESFETAMKVFKEELEMHQRGERDRDRSVIIELELTCKIGSTIWAELKTNFLYDSEGEPTGVIGVIRDITEKKALQTEAIRTSRLAALGELSAGIAHEINDPLNGIINYAEILKDERDEKGEDIDIPDRIIKEGGRIAMIVRNLLSFVRGRQENACQVSVGEVISDTFSLAKKQMMQDKIKLAMDIPPDLPGIKGRAQEIQQVFLNILSNGRHALNQKFPDFHKDKMIEIKGEKVEIDNQDHLRIVFHDRGIGIPSQIQDKICNPFFSTKPPGEGTGLGLSISHGIIKDHGGSLWFESVEGEYSKVFVDLPVWQHEQD